MEMAGEVARAREGCQYCGVTVDRTAVDHIHEYRGGVLDPIGKNYKKSVVDPRMQADRDDWKKYQAGELPEAEYRKRHLERWMA